MRFREVEMALQFPMLQHLQRDYPYLFSLAVRTNPFDSATSVPGRTASDAGSYCELAPHAASEQQRKSSNHQDGNMTCVHSPHRSIRQGRFGTVALVRAFGRDCSA